MTLLEKLKQLFGSDLETEVDDNVKIEDMLKTETVDGKSSDGETKETVDSKSTDNETDVDVKTEGNTTVVNSNKPAVEEKTESKETVSETKEIKTETDVKPDVITEDIKDKVEDIFEDGWFDIETGKLDESKIRDEKIKDAVKLIFNKFNDDRKARLISDAFNKKLENDYSVNVKPETLKKMMDFSTVRVLDDDTVEGIDELFEKLKETEPSLFKDKSKESNPLNEGFNPVVKKSDASPKTFSQAFRIQEEIS